MIRRKLWHGGSDDGSANEHRDSDAAADQHGPGTNEDALDPAQLRDDRRELTHRVARDRDVADAEALATLQKQLAQG